MHFTINVHIGVYSPIICFMQPNVVVAKYSLFDLPLPIPIFHCLKLKLVDITMLRQLAIKVRICVHSPIVGGKVHCQSQFQSF